jgi:regulatory protein
VADFDDLTAHGRTAADARPGVDGTGRLVAGVDDLPGTSRSFRVAGFDTVNATPAAGVSVADFDTVDASTAAPKPVDPLTALTGPRARRPSSSGAGKQGRSGDERDSRPGDDGIPPDAPLPRGRRRGARAGRLGPDAPDPEQPEQPADPVAVAREICLRLLTDRARTRQELAQALARKGVPAEAAAAVLDRFDEVGLIDDAAFAGQWVRSRHQHRGLGRRAIAVELRRKGVADDVAGEALAEVDAESEARRARELVERKLRSVPVGTADQRAAAGRRLVGMLARKGYGAGIAYRVVREALAEHGAQVDELAVDDVGD